MNIISLFCVISLLSTSARSVENGDCHLEGVTASHWITRYINEAVSDTERNEFKRFRVQNVTSVKTQSVDYGKYFDAQIVDDYLIIVPSVAFENYERDESSHSNPEMSVYLMMECADGRTRRLAFYQPINDTNTYAPEFSKSSYIYKLPMPLPANFSLAEFGERIEACDFDISNTRLHFTIKSSEQLSLTWEKPTNGTFKCHFAILKTRSYLRFKEDQVYEIGVTDTGNASKSSVAMLHIHIDKARSIPLNPSFGNKFYWATYSNEGCNHTITINEPIRLENYDSAMTFNILGEYKDQFYIQVVSEEILVSLRENLPTDVLNQDKIFILIEAVLENAEEHGVAVLYIHFPMACPNSVHVINAITWASSNQSTIQFEQYNYWFEAPNHKGELIGIVAATAPPGITIKYFMEEANGSTLPKEIEYEENSGWITLKRRVPAGLYNFIAVAQGLYSTTGATASVTISILDDDVEIMTVVHIRENAPEYTSIPCQPGLDGCEIEVVDQYPPTNPMLFDIRSGYLHNSGIDREMEVLQDMAIPQFLVRLRFKPCPYSRLSSRCDSNTLGTYQEVNREWALVPTNLTTKPGELLIVVIIDDVNDNPPIFDCGSSLVVGYPSIDLLPKIAPSYVTRIHATDFDVGIHSDIKYKINSRHFMVHARTGVIYPKSSEFGDEDNLKFIVRATDMNGDTFVGLSSDLEVEVKPLRQNHLAVLTIGNLILEEFAETVEKLSDKTNLIIQCLTVSVIPNTKRETESQYFLKAVIYAMDTDSKLVEVEELKLTIEGTNILKKFTIKNWEPTTYVETSDTSNTFFFIITIGVLFSLLMILIVAIAICYCFRVFKNRSTEEYHSSKDMINLAKIDFRSIEESVISNSSAPSQSKAHNKEDVEIVENNKQVLKRTDDDIADKTVI